MMDDASGRTRGSHALLALAGLLVGGCGACQTKVPNSDATPPDLQLSYIRNGNVQQIDSDTRETVPRNTDVWVVASANDPDGVRSVVVWGSGQKRCSQEDGEFVTPQFIGNGYSDSDRAPPNTGPGDPTTELRLVNLYGSSDLFYRCGEGEELVGTAIDYRAEAENFHGGSRTSPTLTLVVP